MKNERGEEFVCTAATEDLTLCWLSGPWHSLYAIKYKQRERHIRLKKKERPGALLSNRRRAWEGTRKVRRARSPVAIFYSLQKRNCCWELPIKNFGTQVVFFRQILGTVSMERWEWERTLSSSFDVVGLQIQKRPSQEESRSSGRNNHCDSFWLLVQCRMLLLNEMEWNWRGPFYFQQHAPFVTWMRRRKRFVYELYKSYGHIIYLNKRTVGGGRFKT